MIHGDLVRVNIYNKGRIPWLNIYGPLMNSTISAPIFDLLKTDVSIKMDELDFYNPKKVIKTYGYTKAPIAPVKPLENQIPVEEVKKDYIAPEITIEEEPEVSPEAAQASVGDKYDEGISTLELIAETPVEFTEMVEDMKKEQEISEESKNEIEEELSEVGFVSPEASNDISESELDAEIEAASADYDADNDFIVDYSEEKTNTEIVRYTKKKLEGMTKAQMKQILRDRGYTEGENAPKYHDTLQILIKKILKTQ